MTSSAEGVDLGGLGEEDAARRWLADCEETLASTPIEVTAAGRTFTSIPADVGYDIDTETMLEEAFTEGRTGNVVGQVFWWIGTSEATAGPRHACHLRRRRRREPRSPNGSSKGIDDPPYVGNVEMVGYFVEAEYPRAGTGIDHEAAAEILGERHPRSGPARVMLPTRSLTPP